MWVGRCKNQMFWAAVKEIWLDGVNEQELQQMRRSIRLMEIFAGYLNTAKLHFWLSDYHSFVGFIVLRCLQKSCM